ncbi:A24 family peptidase [Aeoliella sp.]|uniref:A24 family peptidase n=1 Tax=Aeoliella sp. TaxID=2795800 RepID=UPI003CCBA5F6
MFDLAVWQDALTTNWHVWLVTVTIVVMAVIDGIQLRVPNALTYPMIVLGWVYSYTLSAYPGWEGLSYSLMGTVVGLATLLPAYAIGGMGAGDVKMMAGIGAWMWVEVTLYSFAVAAVVGGIMAVAMVLLSGAWNKHYAQFWSIWNEIMVVRDPEKLAEIAAERKPSMKLLPYGIPIAIGTIMYFGWAGLLV